MYEYELQYRADRQTVGHCSACPRSSLILVVIIDLNEDRPGQTFTVVAIRTVLVAAG